MFGFKQVRDCELLYLFSLVIPLVQLLDTCELGVDIHLHVSARFSVVQVLQQSTNSSARDKGLVCNLKLPTDQHDAMEYKLMMIYWPAVQCHGNPLCPWA